MLHMFKPNHLSRLFSGKPRNFTSFRGITRIIFISNPHSVSYSMDLGITFPEDKPVGMVRMCDNVYTTTHKRLRSLIIKHRHNFRKFQVLTEMFLKI